MRKTMHRFLLIALVVAVHARAQQGAPAAASTQPVAPRYQVVVPPGYERITAGGQTALCLPADASWVRQALGQVKPATRPTTAPADLLRRVTENRAAVVKQMVADLGLADDKEPNRLFDEKLIPTLRKMDEMRPPVFFLVSTRDQLRELVAGGWGEPRFRYNRAAGEVAYDDRISLTIDRPMDDIVLAATYAAADPPDARAKRLAADVQQVVNSLAARIAAEAVPAAFNQVGQHLDEKYFVPFKLRRDQVWLGMGANGYFACKYAAQLTGRSKEELLRAMTYEDRRFPVSAAPIDLTRPAEESTLKPGAVPHYNQAMRRKAVAILMRWVEKAGEPSVTKVLVAVRQRLPEDGAALVKLIQNLAGVDLSKDLAAQ
jgi:hypothetical protein